MEVGDYVRRSIHVTSIRRQPSHVVTGRWIGGTAALTVLAVRRMHRATGVSRSRSVPSALDGSRSTAVVVRVDRSKVRSARNFWRVGARHEELNSRGPRLEVASYVGGAPAVGPQLAVQVELASVAIDRDALRTLDANERQVTRAATD